MTKKMKKKKNKLSFQQMLKKSSYLKKYFLKYKKSLITILWVSIVVAVFDAVTPYFMGKIIDSIVTPTFEASFSF